jgi:hypothetical protein
LSLIIRAVSARIAVEIEFIGKPVEVETIAVGRGIRELERLRRVYGPGRW